MHQRTGKPRRLGWASIAALAFMSLGLVAPVLGQRAAPKVEPIGEHEYDLVIAEAQDAGATLRPAVARGLGIYQSDALAQMVTERIMLTADPMPQRWYRLALLRGAAFGPGITVDMKAKDFVERWERSAGVLAGSGVATADIWTRPVDPFDYFNLVIFGNGFARPHDLDGVRASYPQPAKGNEAIEVLVPMQARAIGDADPTRPVLVGFRYFRDAPDADWRPYDLWMYFGPECQWQTMGFPLF